MELGDKILLGSVVTLLSITGIKMIADHYANKWMNYIEEPDNFPEYTCPKNLSQKLNEN